MFKQESLFSQTERPTWNANTCSGLVLGVVRHLLEDHGGMGVHEMAWDDIESMRWRICGR